MKLDSRAKVVCVCMQKGGVGKTTSVVNLARAGSVRGLRVLVIDFDHQGNTTSALARDELAADEVTVADAVSPDDTIPLREVLVPALWAGIDLAPAGSTLTRAERLIGLEDHGREQRLRQALEPLLGDYDLVLIDNGPSLGLLLLNALAAADEVLGVVEADQWSCDGLALLRKTVRMAREYYNPRLSWSGLLISRWRDTKDEKYWLSEIIENFTDAEVLVDEKIPLWTAIKTTIGEGKGLDESPEARLRVLAGRYRRLVSRWVPEEVSADATS